MSHFDGKELGKIQKNVVRKININGEFKGVFCQ